MFLVTHRRENNLIMSLCLSAFVKASLFKGDKIKLLVVLWISTDGVIWSETQYSDCLVQNTLHNHEQRT